MPEAPAGNPGPIAPRRKWSFGWRPDKPDIRDKLMSVNYFSRFSVVLPAQVDLRKDMPPVYDQGELGSCTGNAIAAAVQYCNIKANRPNAVMDRPSRLFIYYNERAMEGSIDSDAGAEIRDGIKSVNKIGTCEESLWPYDVTKFAVKPPRKCYDDARRDLIGHYQRVTQSADYLMAVLAKGLPIVFGISVYMHSIDAAEKTGFVDMPSTRDTLDGGHAILLVGYDKDAKKFLFRNSWGTSWGDNGYGTLPYDYVTSRDLADDFWCIQR